jgi:hypothetical protein
LQALSLDEAVWLDNFYLANITPLFLVETLADLEKIDAKRRPPSRRNMMDDKAACRTGPTRAKQTPQSGSGSLIREESFQSVAGNVFGVGGLRCHWRPTKKAQQPVHRPRLGRLAS